MFMNTNDAVAKRIIKLLREKNITRYKLEQRSGVYHGAMERILNGKNKTVTLATIYKLANGFEMTIYEFLDDDVFRSENLEIE